MSDNAELIAKLRAIGLPRDTADSKLIAQCIHELVVAARDAAHWRRLYIEECGKGDVELENAQRDLRAAAASEAAMRERYDTIVHWAQGTVYDKIDGEVMYCEDCAGKLYDALQQLAVFASTPASALAERYEAVVTAARKCIDAERHSADDGISRGGGGVWWFTGTASAIALADTIAALDHPTPAKDDEA